MTVLERAFYEASINLLKTLRQCSVMPKHAEDAADYIAKLTIVEAELHTLYSVTKEYEHQLELTKRKQ